MHVKQAESILRFVLEVGGGGSCGGNTGDSCRKGHGRQAQLRGGCSHGMHGDSRKVDEGWA